MSEERINKVGETYRAIRNALRYQLSNLYDFDPAQHSVPDEKLTGLDRWILGEFSKLESEVIAAYDAYEFHVVYQKLSQFIAVELSSVYHDVIKDWLYTDAANSPRRRSTQTALHRLVTGLCQMLAPILAFTADEAWEFVPGKNVNSVHEANWTTSNFNLPSGEITTWALLLSLRSFILPELEKARQAKNIGKALEAKVTLSGGNAIVVNSNAEAASALRELVNVSQLELVGKAGESDSVFVAKADGQKCERCWHCETDIGQKLRTSDNLRSLCRGSEAIQGLVKQLVSARLVILFGFFALMGNFFLLVSKHDKFFPTTWEIGNDRQEAFYSHLV